MTHPPPSLDCLVHELYATAVREPDGDALWDPLTQGLAQALGLPLVLLGHYEPQGVVTVLGMSQASRLWSALQRLPERWDGSVVGRGLAALALESRGLATLELDDERFVCWRDGAERDDLRSGAALFVDGALGRFVIELFAAQPRGFDEDFGRRLLELRERLLDFLRDLAQLREQRLLARALEGAGNAAFITDREGTIVWCNDAFTRLYGYSHHEAVGQNPRFLKSGKQGVRYYRDLWATIRSGKVWAGETVDRDRNGIPYTVRQTISPFARDEQLSH
ncbi:MAG: PAS domain-containing protein, partial [Gammaproteobacteria bacterium]